MKKHQIVIVNSALLCVLLISAYTISIWPRRNTFPPLTVPTQEISRTQGIGGVPTTHQAAEPSPATSRDGTPTGKPQAATPRDHLEAVAPRQAQITAATPKEYPYRALMTSNDPLPQPTWVLNATRQQTAWNTATGTGAIVAVIDSGFALGHEDLLNQWYQNSGETGTTKSGDRCWSGTTTSKSTNGCDDDDNGYVDDWRGWDFVGATNTPQAGRTAPSGAGVSHGTEVAGLVGATGNNGVGTATVSWNNRIMPLQALDDDGSGYTSSVTSAIYYAVDNGATVINMSLGGDTDDPSLAAAIDYAYQHGVVVVAAAGNCGTGGEQGCDPSKPGAMGYPALNRHVLAVGAVTSTNSRASFSSYGPGLDVTAPGSGTLVSTMWQPTNQTSAYATSLYGTSFASPIVASYVGLLKSLRPGTSADDIIAIVDATAWKPVGMNSGNYTIQFGHGIIDSNQGIRVAAALNQSSTQPELLQTGNEKSEHQVADSSLMSSGCKTASTTYCTIWAQNSLGFDRYLPYTLTNASGQAGWSWTGDWLGSGDWSLKSRSGSTTSSTPYQLLNK